MRKSEYVYAQTINPVPLPLLSRVLEKVANEDGRADWSLVTVIHAGYARVSPSIVSASESTDLVPVFHCIWRTLWIISEEKPVFPNIDLSK